MPADLVDAGHRFEAWTLPNVGTFTRKFDLSKWVTYTIAEKYGSISDGKVELPADFAKLARLFNVDKANHANDVGSVIRVLDGTTPLTHFVLKGLDDKWSSEGQTLTGLLEGMDYFLDRALVPNFDYPAAPTVEPDWHYGLPSILFNTDFEDGGLTNFLIHLWVEAGVSAGTWNIEFDDGATADDVTLNWDADLPAVQTGIEGLTNVTDISISGDGTETNPWVIEVIAPAGTDYNVTIDSTGLTGGAALHLAQSQGGAGITAPWERSFNPATGLFHGVYFNFEISTAEAHTGTRSLYVKGALGDWPQSYPGAQQRVSATGGRLYRDSVWVKPVFSRRYRFGLRTEDETWIAEAEADLTAGSWQEVKFPATVPNHIRSVIFRISCISDTDGHEFYVDDALFAPGADAATFGKIMGELLAALQALGLLTWVTKTWTDTHDSAGVAWDRNLVWSVKHRQSLLQLVEYADRWNYESDGIHWSTANSRFEWGLYNPAGGGANKQGTGMAVIGKVISESGTISKRIPDASHYYAEGDLGYWGEFEDATLAGAWGTLQKSYFNAQGLDTASMVEQATRLVENAADRTDGLITRLAASPIKPWIDFKPGDRNVMVNLMPKRAREYLRCMAIVATKGPGDATPTYDVHWGSQVYLAEAAHLETTRRLVRAFAAQRPATSVFDGRPAPVVSATGGSAPSLVVAPANAPDSSKARADFVEPGDGKANLIWQQVINRLAAGGGGRLLMTEGLSVWADEVTVVGDLRIEGMGQASHIQMGSGSNANMFHLVSPFSSAFQLDSLRLDGQKTVQSSGTPTAIRFEPNAGTGQLIIHNCNIHSFRGAGVFLDRPAARVVIAKSIIQDNTGHGIDMFVEGNFHFSDTTILGNGGEGIRASGTALMMVNCRITNNTSHGFNAGGVFESTPKIIVGNQFVGNGGYGLSWDGVNGQIVGNYIASNLGQAGAVFVGNSPLVVSGNTFTTNTGFGAMLTQGGGATGGAFTGNVVKSNNQHGVYVEGANWLIDSNRLHGNGLATTNTYDDIHVAAPGDDCAIRSNLIRPGGGNLTRYAIHVVSGATNNWVAGNDALGTFGTARYNLVDASTIQVWAGTVGDNR